MQLLKNNTISKRIYFTLFIIILLRVGNIIPIPYIDHRYLITILDKKPWLKTFFNNKTLILNIFSLGIVPSINASIIMQILTNILPSFEILQKEEGEAGRRKLKEYTRLLTLFFAIVESISIVFALKPIVFNWSFEICFQIWLSLVTGSMVVLWLSDLITENGIGNGSSIVITLNIFSSLPNTLKNLNSLNNSSIFFNIIGFLFLMIGIIYLQSGVRLIPLVSAKQLLAAENKQVFQRSFLPLKLDQGGVMPVIFSSTTITFITFCLNSLLNLFSITISESQNFVVFYRILNFILIFLFSRLYSNLILNPKEIAKELNKMSITIPNIRPGKQTAKFLRITLNRLSFLGSIFLASLVTIPNVCSSSGFGITSLIILVGVTIDTSRQIKTLKISQKY